MTDDEIKEDAKRKFQIELLERVKLETQEALSRLNVSEETATKNYTAFMQALRYAFWTGFCYGMVASVFVVLLSYWWSHK